MVPPLGAVRLSLVQVFANRDKVCARRLQTRKNFCVRDAHCACRNKDLVTKVKGSCGGSDVRIIWAASSLCGRLNQSHTRSIGLLASFRFRSSKRGSAKGDELRKRDASGKSRRPEIPDAREVIRPSRSHVLKLYAFSLGNSLTALPRS